MRKNNIIEKSMQEQYYDGEVEYIDETYVSSYMNDGLEDCIDYLSKNEVDDNVLWLKNNGNSGKFYREPYNSQSSKNISNSI